MKALYALPDHLVIKALVPALARRHLSVDEGIARVTGGANVVPLAIDPGPPGHVLWGDIGPAPFREWQFMYTIERLAGEGAIRDGFSTDIDILLEDDVATEGLAPCGFIFHISRCGSTLLAKALARDPAHLVINQGGPLQRGFWAWLTDDWTHEAVADARHLRMFRNLVLALTRRRDPAQKRAFVKLISWNVLYQDFIARAFPERPALFLYRDPVEVIASVRKETTAALEARGTRQAGFLTGVDWRRTTAMDDTLYLAKCYANYFRAALSTRDEGLRYINYRAINRDNFRAVLDRGLGLQLSENSLTHMLEQFRYHSKDDSDTLEFRADGQAKRAHMALDECHIVERECSGLIEQLESSPRYLFPVGHEKIPELVTGYGDVQ